MRYVVVFLLFLAGCNEAPGDVNTEITRSVGLPRNHGQDSVAVVTVVQNFFRAFDDKDTGRITDLLLPYTKLIHHNGAITNTAEMNAVIQGTKDWWPRKRTLSQYEFTEDSSLAILGLKNEVTFSLPGNKSVYEPYQETWIFGKVGQSWKPIRIHYSKVTVEKHSEDVK
jgi:hypothetical protein